MTIYSAAIIGSQVGDEGKGAITDRFSVDYDWVIRFGGGDNVGAKVYRRGKSFVHHLLPVVNYETSQAKSFLASGMVINMPALLDELLTMQKDFPDVGKSVYIDMDAFIVLPEHIELDKVEGVKQGTTYRGIKQAYTSKVNRTGTRVYDLINDNADVIKALKEQGVQFTTALAMRPVFEKSKLLFEGHQGSMLSLIDGLYPYITSSDTGVGAIYSAGFHWVDLDKVYGIAKPYITRSGGRAMPTEMSEEEAKVLVERGGEFGNTTGRARGIAFMDLVALKYAVERTGIDALILTKLDVMNGQEVKVCHSYGKSVYSPNDFRDVMPQYTVLDGWKDATDRAQIKSFIEFVQNQVGVDVEYYSHGVGKEDLKSWTNHVEVEQISNQVFA